MFVYFHSPSEGVVINAADKTWEELLPNLLFQKFKMYVI